MVAGPQSTSQPVAQEYMSHLPSKELLEVGPSPVSPAALLGGQEVRVQRNLGGGASGLGWDGAMAPVP